MLLPSHCRPFSRTTGGPILIAPRNVLPRYRLRFARVEMISEPPRLAGPIAPSAPATGLIEIVLPDGASIRVDAQVDEPALRRVLAALDKR
jgi:hypothetical protein